MSKATLFAFLGGALIGSLATWLLTRRKKHVVEMVKVEEAPEERPSIDIPVKKPEVVEKVESVEIQEDEDEVEVEEPSNGVELSRSDIQELIKEYSGQNDEGPKDDPELEEPYEITEEEYANDFELSRCETLRYYQGDMVLVDEHYNKIEDPSYVIGKVADCLSGDTRNMIYVRDEIKDVMYEIEMYHDCTYDHEVLGLGLGSDYM